MELTQSVIDDLKQLEESLWKVDTRFDRAYQESIFAEDCVEFGRSGRIYSRTDMIVDQPQKIDIKLPLEDFQVRSIDDNSVLVTYRSEVQYEELEVGNRSSIWVKSSEGWKLLFHQGTAVTE